MRTARDYRTLQDEWQQMVSSEGGLWTACRENRTNYHPLSWILWNCNSSNVKQLVIRERVQMSAELD